MEIKQLFSFLSFIHAFEKIDRQYTRVGEDRQENDAEHSFQLAMMAWYINEEEKLGLDTGKLLKYALAHDLVEVYAGDTYAHTTDKEEKDTKHQRELEAAQRIKKEFPEFAELHPIIEAYEARENEEAKFVYALDKILPPMTISMDGGKSWKKLGVTLEMVKEYKKDKVKESPVIEKYYKEIMKILEGKPEVFG